MQEDHSPKHRAVHPGMSRAHGWQGSPMCSLPHSAAEANLPLSPNIPEATMKARGRLAGEVPAISRLRDYVWLVDPV